MSEQLTYENFNSTTIGVYRQNTLFMRFKSLGDIYHESGCIHPNIIAANVHEYIHYFHNISTASGITYLYLNIISLRLMVDGCNQSGHFMGGSKLLEGRALQLNDVINKMNIILGTTSIQELKSITDIKKCNFGRPSLIHNKKNNDEVIITKCEVNIEHEDKTKKSVDVIVGLSFITEGIAYEIERYIRHNNGMLENELDIGTAIYPYLSFKKLVEQWSEQSLDSIQLIKVGIAALSFIYPGHGLATICEKIKESEETFDNILDAEIKSQKIFLDSMMSNLEEQLTDLSQGDVLSTAIKEYLELVKKGLSLREGNSYMELDFLKCNPIDISNFERTIKSMVDCFVIQEKYDEQLDIYWLGEGANLKSDETIARIATLQCLLHFSQLHFKITSENKFVATSDLPLNITCPFSGGCLDEKRRGNPKECKNNPWMNYLSEKPGEKVCWYASGVKSLKNE
ncbi:hypothetical protein GKR71_13140 [Providencia sp. wls1922]|uniref:hypothetical protein n=1 Tax=Providencia sp. wls1922 TaxID=2675152 RepID=UPI0012B605B4|nr:hypothetical protein [Providencia sp. wls1922]MTC46782.1 hypothetical protein [Providencia sp. wls1922]